MLTIATTSALISTAFVGVGVIFGLVLGALVTAVIALMGLGFAIRKTAVHVFDLTGMKIDGVAFTPDGSSGCSTCGESGLNCSCRFDYFTGRNVPAGTRRN